ncbi:MAG: tetraacyldisaccharide 4'-kinase [Deltaproteobacteria bacterium]|nr:tetraacyldisaccharide 4'-kinase [Deltaproteobacteria bacterium]MBW2361493.1 tetraacyldisaccharide 4'-kinase [Deltaproteobacteria bacterium]
MLRRLRSARAAWLESDAEGASGRVLRALLAPLGVGYAIGARLHRGAYRRGRRRAERLPCRVVSVGSLAAGGAGKTPAAAWLAAGLRRRGHRVALLSRGYGRREGEGVAIVSDGRFVRASLAQAGDEPLVLAAHAAGVPVLVGRDRVRAGRRALATFGSELVVLDDGFQHLRLQRDIDLVLVDGTAGFGNRRCLPAGPLREPLAALALADAVGIVDGPLADDDEVALAAAAPDAWRFAARRRPATLRPLGGGPAAAAEQLRGREVGLLCGVAEPASVRRTLAELGARVVAERRFRDHHVYAPGDVGGLAQAAPLWVTTEKDAVKLPASWVVPADVRVLAIEFAPDEPAALLDWIEAKLR